jgi:hypothetical protein
MSWTTSRVSFKASFKVILCCLYWDCIRSSFPLLFLPSVIETTNKTLGVSSKQISYKLHDCSQRKGWMKFPYTDTGIHRQKEYLTYEMLFCIACSRVIWRLRLFKVEEADITWHDYSKRQNLPITCYSWFVYSVLQLNLILDKLFTLSLWGNILNDSENKSVFVWFLVSFKKPSFLGNSYWTRFTAGTFVVFRTCDSDAFDWVDLRS